MTSLRPKLLERVLVYLKRLPGDKLEKAQFKQCILEYLGCSGLDVSVRCSLKENKLILTSAKSADTSGITLKHPPFCPCSNLSAEAAESIPQEALERGVDCGVATLLWSCDRHLLLTRRASHLRIFPGVWVTPGGHIELNETLVEAGLRELKEETGITVDAKECSPSLVALWESVYPPYLSRGLPKRHHIVLYQTVTSSKDHHQLNEELCIDPTEVGAAAWLDESMVRTVATLSQDGLEGTRLNTSIPAALRAVVVDQDTGQTSVQDMSTSVFLEKAPDFGEDVERLSTGTRFAMQHWCEKNPRK